MEMNREFLQLAHDLNPKKHTIGGWYVSEKLDGMRAFWDGGISTGMRAADVPFANTEKHARFKEEVISTGLWSRYGQVIRAPKWWLDKLPKNLPLDGELWMGRGAFQSVMSTVKDHVASAAWKDVRYMVFEIPPISRVLADGRINNPNFRKTFEGLQFWGGLNDAIRFNAHVHDFMASFMKIKNYNIENEVVTLVNQERLPLPQDAALEIIETKCVTISQEGGEGLMLRKPESIWIPKRTKELLKVKKLIDDEATVVGYISGRRTDRGSKLLGKMGALIVSWEGKQFELSGFTDEERMFSNYDQAAHAAAYPGKEMPVWVKVPHFPVGSKVTFRYRELTKDGVPKEARFYRKAV